MRGWWSPACPGRRRVRPALLALAALSGLLSAALAPAQTVTTLTVADAAAVTEGALLRFTLTYANAPSASSSYTVLYTVSETGDMVLAEDKGSLELYETGVTAADPTVVLSVSTVADATEEPDSTVTLTLTSVTAGRTDGTSDVTPAALGATLTATGLVRDDDAPPPVLSIAAGAAVTEGAPASFTLDISPKPTATTTYTVTYTVSETGEMVAADEEGAGKSITFAWALENNPDCYTKDNLSGNACDDTVRVVRVPTLADTTVEADSALTVTLTAVSAVLNSGTAATPAPVLAAATAATLTVADDDAPNAAPVFSSADSARVAENTSAVLTVAATDADSADSVTGYTLVGGADRAQFTLDQTSGALTFVRAPDFERPTDVASATPANVAGNNEYLVTLRASSGTGTRALSAEQVLTVTVTDDDTEAPGAPDAPTLAAPAGTTDSLTLSWAAPANTGPDITDYDLRYRAGAGGDFSDWAHAGTATTATLTGLSAATAYEAQVQARNAEGTSDWSASGTGTTSATPMPPPMPPPGSADALVSNLSNLVGAYSAYNISKGNLVQGAAQGFTTGANVGGYALSSVDLAVADASSTAARVTVTVRKAAANSGRPNPIIHTLTTGSDFGANRVNSFTAPADATLEPETDYFVVAEVPHDDLENAGLRWSRTTDVSETGAVGWEIADTFWTRASATASWSGISSVAAPLKLRLNGSARAGGNNPATGAPVILVEGEALGARTPRVGQTLTVDTAAIADLDGLPDADNDGRTDFSYQWLRGEDEIATATGASYRPGAADLGSTLTVRVSFTDAGGNAERRPSAATAAVAAAQSTVTIAARDGVTTVTEGTAAVFTLARTAPLAGELTVTVQVSEEGQVIAAPADYRTALALTFPMNEASVALPVATGADADYEELAGAPGIAGSIKATLQAGDGYTSGADASATIAVRDDDPSPITLSIDADPVSEGAGAVEVAVKALTAHARAPAGLRLSATTRDGSALAPDDYTALDATPVAFAAADFELVEAGTHYEAKTSFTVPLVDDALDEDNETFELVFGWPSSPPAHVTLPPAHTVTLLDDDTAPSAPALTATPGDLQVVLSWVAPAEPGTSPLRGYQYRVSADGGSNWAPDWTAVPDSADAGSAAADETGVTVPGLSNGTAYAFEVRALSAAGAGAAARQTATPVAPPNAAPVFSSAATASVAENTTPVLTVAATDADSADSVTGYTLVGGADRAQFAIEAASGVLTFLSAPDFERPTDVTSATPANGAGNNEYVVTLRASSGTGARALSTDQTLTVTVTDDDTEAPGTPDAPTLAAPAGTTDSLTLSWAAPTNSGPDITDYDLRYRAGASGDFSDWDHTGTATTATLTGLAAGTAYTAQVRARNAEGDSPWSASGTGTTNVADNAAPVFSSAATASVAENSAGTVLTVAATDADSADDVTGYTLVGGADRAQFALDQTSGALTFVSAPDFEAPQDVGRDNGYRVTVRAGSGTGARALSTDQGLTLTVTDVDEPPGTPDAPTLAVGASADSLTLTWAAPTNSGPPITDYDLRYRAGASGDFSDWAHTGTATTATLTGLAAATAYEAQVRAQNAEGAGPWSASGTGTTVTPVTVAVAAAAAVTEGTDLVFTLRFANAPAASSTVTVAYTVTETGAMVAAADKGEQRSSFEISDVQLTKVVPLATVADAVQEPDSTVTLTLTGVTVDETDSTTPVRAALGATLTATGLVRDDDAPPPVLSIAAGAAVTEGADATFTLAINPKPTATTTYTVTYTVSETGEMVAADEEGANKSITFAWALENNSDCYTKDNLSGNACDDTVRVVRVPTVADTTVEADSALTVTLTAVSAVLNSGTAATPAPVLAAATAATLTVADDDVANAAPVFSSSATANVAENTTPVLTVAATDADSADSVTGYTLVGGADRAQFAIEAASGVLTFLSAPDFERPTDVTSATPANGAGNNEYVVTLRASSGTGARALSTDQTLTVTVTDDDTEAPGTPDAPTLAAPAGTTDSLTLSWAAPTNSGPDITDYDLRYRAGASGDFSDWDHTGTATTATLTGLAAGTAYTAQVRARNAEGDSPWSASGTGTTNVADNAAPVFSSAATASVAENSAGTVLTVAATDADSADDVTGYTLVGGADRAQFALDQTSGALTFVSAPDFEAPQDVGSDNGYRVTVRAGSGTGARALSTDQGLTLTVTDVDEPPGTPDAPTLAVGASADSLTLTWAAPTNSGPPITDYDLRYRAGASGDFSDWAHTGTATTATLTGLSAATAYEAQVRAHNAEGAGPWSASGTGTTGTPAPVLSIAPVHGTVTEGEQVVFEVARAPAAATPLAVALTVTDAGAVLAAGAAGAQQVTIDADMTSARLTLGSTDDEAWEPHTEVTATLTAASDGAYTLAPDASATVLVNDNDLPRIDVALETLVGGAPPAETGGVKMVAESAGLVAMRVVATTPGDTQPHYDFSVTLSTRSGTAVSPDDYDVFTANAHVAASAYVRDAASATWRAVVTVGSRGRVLFQTRIIDDPLAEGDEQFILKLERAPGLVSQVQITNEDTHVTIIDDDVLPGAPSGLSATPGDRSATLRWGAPAEPGTSPLDRYEVRVSADAGVTWGEWTAGPRPPHPRPHGGGPDGRHGVHVCSARAQRGGGRPGL